MTLDLEFITPAFLCGANQNKAELRAPSIRGELRWWFRVLGADAEEERDLFGGVHGEPTASRLVVRVRDVQAKHEELPRFAPWSELDYLYYFAVSGNKENVHRTQREAFFAPETRFKADILERRPLPEQTRRRFTQTVEAFARLGTLGLRATRGCGALVQTDAVLTRQAFAAWVGTLPGTLLVGLSEDRVFDSWKRCHEALGGYLRALRKDNHLSGKAESALGFSIDKERASSALRLRPVRVKEGYLPVLVYTDEACRQTSLESLLKSRIINLTSQI